MNANTDPTPEPVERLDKDHGDEVPPPTELDIIPADRKSAGKKDKDSLM